jgi:putative SOS response-associated peptidase YedK
MRAIINEVGKQFGSSAKHAYSKGDIFPSGLAPILALQDSALTPMIGVWGFNHWETGKPAQINARNDRALVSRFWKESLLTSRCVIPAAAFYEWCHIHVDDYREFQAVSIFPDGFRDAIADYRSIAIKDRDRAANLRKSRKIKSVPFRFSSPGRPPLYMAGMRQVDAQGTPQDNFAILTADAAGCVGIIHDRMPVILQPDELEAWVADEGFMKSVLGRRGPELVAARAG